MDDLTHDNDIRVRRSKTATGPALEIAMKPFQGTNTVRFSHEELFLQAFCALNKAIGAYLRFGLVVH